MALAECEAEMMDAPLNSVSEMGCRDPDVERVERILTE